MERSYLPELGAAIRKGDLELVKRLVVAHPNMLNVETPFGSWLDMAAQKGQLEIVKYFDELGLDVHRINHHGQTAICCAAESGDPLVVAYLIKRGARVTIDTRDECANPMFGAISSQSPDIAQLLLANGLDASIDYGNGKTVLSFALLHGASQVAEVIAAHLGDNDEKKKCGLLAEAKKHADRQLKLVGPIRILPTVDDLEN
jgi:uncharacterized protein